MLDASRIVSVSVLRLRRAAGGLPGRSPRPGMKLHAHISSSVTWRTATPFECALPIRSRSDVKAIHMSWSGQGPGGRRAIITAICARRLIQAALEPDREKRVFFRAGSPLPMRHARPASVPRHPTPFRDRDALRRRCRAPRVRAVCRASRACLERTGGPSRLPHSRMSAGPISPSPVTNQLIIRAMFEAGSRLDDDPDLPASCRASMLRAAEGSCAARTVPATRTAHDEGSSSSESPALEHRRIISWFVTGEGEIARPTFSNAANGSGRPSFQACSGCAGKQLEPAARDIATSASRSRKWR